MTDDRSFDPVPFAALPELLAGRRSCRAFTAKPVPRSDVENILRAARRAPSGANLQPGGFHALTGTALHGLCGALAENLLDGPEPAEYSYFPDPMPPFLKERQRAAGYALYRALGIERRDLAGRKEQFDANYRFFDAPVGIVVTIRRDMGAGCYMDLGMALMALMLMAEHLGYGTCGIGALANHAQTVHHHLGLDPEELVVCGIALGHAAEGAPVNRFRTERADLADYATLRGFGDAI